MSASSNAQTDIVWPGYVAAIASLLLSLLLVLAILVVTISQVGNVAESYEQAIANAGFQSNEDVEKAAKLAGISGNQIPVINASLSLTPSQDTVVPLDIERANFDQQAARDAAKLIAEDKVLLAQIDLSKVDVTKVKFAGLDISKIDLFNRISSDDLKKIDFSLINWDLLEPARVEILKPFIAKEAIRYQLQRKKPTQSSAAKTAPTDLVNTSESGRSTGNLQITFIDDATSPLAAQKRQLLQAFEVLQRTAINISMRINLPNEDAYLKRMAYARLLTLHALAIESGFAAPNIQLMINTVPSATMPLRNMVIYVSTAGAIDIKK
jgi:Na+-transporting methylmalonyl-CoA/oxaloacetate decarboxylase gamma subunit